MFARACTLLEVVPAIAATDEGTEQDTSSFSNSALPANERYSSTPRTSVPQSARNSADRELAGDRTRRLDKQQPGARNWEIEMPFKKPFRLSSTIEVMPGLGPTWTHTTQSGAQSSTWGAVAVIDCSSGVPSVSAGFLEPSYGIALGNGNKKVSGPDGRYLLRRSVSFRHGIALRANDIVSWPTPLGASQQHKCTANAYATSRTNGLWRGARAPL